MKNFLLIIILAMGPVCLIAQKADTLVGWRTGGVAGLNFSQSAYNNWVSGGQNAISVTALFSLNIKYKKADGTKEVVHMNDATAFAMGRILIAILENYQNKDGSITVPEVLRQYIPGKLDKISR